MNEPYTETANDSLLVPYLNAASDEAAQHMLEEVISAEAMPIIRRVVGAARLANFHSRGNWEERDVEHDIVLRLVKHLRFLRRDSSAGSIADFHRYVGRTSKNVCNTVHRRNNPRWTSVKHKLEYYLTEDAQYGAWYGEEIVYGEQRLLLCGLNTWRDRERHRGSLNPQKLSLFISSELAASHHPITDPQRLTLGDLIPLLFEHAGAPLPLNEVVTLVAILWKVREDAQIEIDGGGLGSSEFDGRQEMVTIYEDRQMLRQLWEEIQRLPPSQQKALLLSMKTQHGRDALALLTHTNTTAPKQLAALLGMSLDQLEELSGRLPLRDTELAEQMGLTRQQVINLRATARRRLGRWMERIKSTHPASTDGNHLARKAS